MRTILQCAFAAIFITSARGLYGTPRPVTGEPNQVSAAAQTSPDLARMEEVVQSYWSEKKFMGCVLVARGSHVLLDKGYGFANLEWDIPNSPAAKFRLGSVTKQFTAASILLPQERGKLKVTDPVKKYMQDAPAAWDKITIFNLLTHTSGIPNFTSFPDYESQEPFATTPEKLVVRFRDKPLDFPPGEKISYSNSGYVLLGYFIKRPAARVMKSLSRKTSSRRSGSYQLAPNFIMTIPREDDHLSVQASGQPEVQIYPKSDRDYFLKVVDAQITFVTDSNGRATELILRQGDMDQHAKRIE